jgi:Cu2+-exporting ATPase
MSAPHHHDHSRSATVEHEHTDHGAGQPLDHHNHGQHGDTDTHGQAMPSGHAHSGLDEDHVVHAHGEHAGHSTAMFKNKFWLSLALSVPVVYFSPMVGHLLGYHALQFPGSAWIAPVLGTIIFFYGGLPFLKGGITELKSRQPGMMLLISMAISVAFVASWVTTLGIGGFDLDFWWELALLVVIMPLGRPPRPWTPWPHCCPTRPRRSWTVRPSPFRSPSWPWVTSCWSVPGPGCRPMEPSPADRRSSTSP